MMKWKKIKRNWIKENIEKYIGKSEFYKSYYDVHGQNKIVYTDWYHTYNQEIDGVFNDKDALWKWSNDYQYLLLNSYKIDENNGKRQSELHLFFEMKDNDDPIEKMKNDEFMKTPLRRIRKLMMKY